jgi:2-polyprenyl-6-methoxyphenol hydroxylase-like FAD-dependent oxidoreductase
MSDLNVLISGSGIAGSVFAFWLLRAYPNANITIVERDPSPRLTGAGVDIRSSAVDIINWMGAEQGIRNQMTNEEGMQVVDVNGNAVEHSERPADQTFRASHPSLRSSVARLRRSSSILS